MLTDGQTQPMQLAADVKVAPLEEQHRYQSLQELKNSSLGTLVVQWCRNVALGNASRRCAFNTGDNPIRAYMQQPLRPRPLRPDPFERRLSNPPLCKDFEIEHGTVL